LSLYLLQKLEGLPEKNTKDVAEQPFDKEIMRATPEPNYIIQQKLIIDI
jgi:hypothetical protein